MRDAEEPWNAADTGDGKDTPNKRGGHGVAGRCKRAERFGFLAWRHEVPAFLRQGPRTSVKTGVLLSGGQWQRIALARALLRGGRDLVILDEPSSGLDAEAEYEIHASLRAHRSGSTTILISHRLNAVRDADSIVVLDDGMGECPANGGTAIGSG